MPTFFTLINPTTAAFAGEITSSSDPSLVGQFYAVEVVGNSKSGIPDQIGIDITKTQPDCTKVNVRMHDMIRGSDNFF